ncbi:uncharacterized protein LOC142239876 [Haematobia irritans]|uniref:uncharacterized protein LOC142239876 n=1 Tax=Haematobia irritans TaxID=7368 RepID=UPI003F50B870
MTHKRTSRNTQKEKFILNTFEETSRFLRKHKEIIVTKSDKGNKTVIMYKKDYEEKMEKLLDDKTTYKTIREDPTQKLQRKNNKIITDLFKNGYISVQEKFKLTSNAANAPRLYGLPKIHKLNMPLRPISSSVEVPCYNMSKHVGSIIKNLISEKYNIKNSYELKDRLKNVSLDENDILVSFDVVSLFTNIPIHLAIKNIMTQWKSLETHTKIPKTQFLKLLQFCLNDNNYFKYGEILYYQTYGMPMGNPLSPTIADIVLDNMLAETIKELSERNITIKFITKYVDDLFAVIKKEDEDIILATFNKYHNKLQFTIEKETNNCLPYLDVKLHRNNDKISTEWYTKSIASGRIINFHSTQPFKQKINTAMSLIQKSIKLSDQQFQTANLKKVENILLKNSFPQYIINNLIKKSTTQTQKSRNNTDDNKTLGNTMKYYSISYIPKLTETTMLKEIVEDQQTTFAHKPNKTLSTIFTQTKTKIEKTQQSNVVYEIKCIGNDEQPCNKYYVGTTKRSLATRVTEHEADIRKGRHTTALAQHCIELGHKADFESVKILDKERKENKRYTLESLRIQQRVQCAINRKEDKDNTNAAYILAIM